MSSVRKVKTPGISSSSTVLKAFSPDFEAWTALEVLPQPRASKERAMWNLKKSVGLWKQLEKHTNLRNSTSNFFGGFRARVRVIPSLIFRTSKMTIDSQDYHGNGHPGLQPLLLAKICRMKWEFSQWNIMYINIYIIYVLTVEFEIVWVSISSYWRFIGYTTVDFWNCV